MKETNSNFTFEVLTSEEKKAIKGGVEDYSDCGCYISVGGVHRKAAGKEKHLIDELLAK